MKSLKDLQEKVMKAEISPEAAVEMAHEIGLNAVRTYQPPSVNELKTRYATNVALRLRAQQSNVPFITTEAPDFKLSQGLILMGGVSGRGKSTAAANIIAGFLDHADGRALFLTNEESSADVYDKIACVQLQLSFREFRSGRLPGDELQMVEDQSRLIMDRVVVEEGSEQYDMSCLEDVQGALLYAAKSGFGIAMLDYAQTVTWSRLEPNLEPVQVSKKLGFFMKDFGRKAPIPVIMFVQLKPEAEGAHFKDRVENDRTLFNHCFTVIEIVPDFEAKRTRFKFLKDRFGDSQGKELEMIYRGGRFEYAPEGI